MAAESLLWVTADRVWSVSTLNCYHTQLNRAKSAGYKKRHGRRPGPFIHCQPAWETTKKRPKHQDEVFVSTVCSALGTLTRPNNSGCIKPASTLSTAALIHLGEYWDERLSKKKTYGSLNHTQHSKFRFVFCAKKIDGYHQLQLHLGCIYRM